MKAALFSTLLGLALIGCTKGTSVDDSSDTQDTEDTNHPSNDTIATATVVAFTDGVIQETDAIEAPGDRDFYKFEVTEGNWYVLMSAGYTAGGGEPDTVLRVYDKDETMIGENDDQPYRWGNTDSGYVFRARYTGTYYAEVLEWTDWAGETPDGGDDWAYDFIVFEWPDGELLDVSPQTGNDTTALAAAALDTLDDTDTANDVFQQYLMPIPYQYGDGYGWSTGDISSATDVDYFGYRADNSDSQYTGEVVQFGMYPDADTDWDPSFKVVTADGTVVADGSADPEITADYNYFWKSGITFPIGADAGDYFLEVKDASAGSGPTHWYDFISVSYPATFVPTSGPATVQVVMETDPAGTSLFNMVESSSTAGYYYGRGSGWLDGDDTNGIDYWKITAASVGTGGTFNLTTDVASAGSLVHDLKVEVFTSDPTSGSPTAVTSDDGLDPIITDYTLPSMSGTSLWLKVTSISGDDGYYNLLVSVE